MRVFRLNPIHDQRQAFIVIKGFCYPRNFFKSAQSLLFLEEMGHDSDFGSHFAASTVAAIINFPLWRASAIAQSGFKLDGSNFVIRYYQAAVKPPFKGLVATISGMAWARGAIFCKSIIRYYGVLNFTHLHPHRWVE